MDRRTFLANVGTVAAWAAVPIAISACGGDGDSSTDPDPNDPDPNDPGQTQDVPGVVTATGGHTHDVKITGAQIDAATSVTLTLTNGGHTHTVSLTTANVVAIGNGEQVLKTSSNDNAHAHTVTFN